VVVGDVEAVAVEGHQVVGADQVLGVPDRPGMPQALPFHVEHLHNMILGPAVVDDKQSALAILTAEQTKSVGMERKAQRILIRQNALRQRLPVQVEREDRPTRLVLGTEQDLTRLLIPSLLR